MEILTESRSWSKSQVSALRECPRKHLFSSQKPRSPWAEQNAALFDEVIRLKKIKNRFLWVGSVVHETIASVLGALSQGSPVPSKDDALLQMKERMRTEFRQSKEGQDTVGRLFEHVFDQTVAPEAWKQQWDVAEKALTWFLQSKWLERLRSFGPEVWKAINQVLEFDVEGTKAYTKIDCGLDLNGRFVLIDWKTSQPKEADLSNLLVSALYAHDVWGADPASIECMAVSLLDGRTLKASVSEESLMDIHMKIQDEATELQTNIRDGATDPFQFPPPANPVTCERCVFQKLCYPGGFKSLSHERGNYGSLNS